MMPNRGFGSYRVLGVREFGFCILNFGFLKIIDYMVTDELF
jgi:hypothetical protein